MGGLGQENLKDLLCRGDQDRVVCIFLLSLGLNWVEVGTY